MLQVLLVTKVVYGSFRPIGGSSRSQLPTFSSETPNRILAPIAIKKNSCTSAYLDSLAVDLSNYERALEAASKLMNLKCREDTTDLTLLLRYQETGHLIVRVAFNRVQYSLDVLQDYPTVLESVSKEYENLQKFFPELVKSLRQPELNSQAQTLLRLLNSGAANAVKSISKRPGDPSTPLKVYAPENTDSLNNEDKLLVKLIRICNHLVKVFTFISENPQNKKLVINREYETLQSIVSKLSYVAEIQHMTVLKEDLESWTNTGDSEAYEGFDETWYSHVEKFIHSVNTELSYLIDFYEKSNYKKEKAFIHTWISLSKTGSSLLASHSLPVKPWLATLIDIMTFLDFGFEKHKSFLLQMFKEVSMYRSHDIQAELLHLLDSPASLLKSKQILFLTSAYLLSAGSVTLWNSYVAVLNALCEKDISLLDYTTASKLGDETFRLSELASKTLKNSLAITLEKLSSKLSEHAVSQLTR
jgi:hypothetical protein